MKCNRKVFKMQGIFVLIVIFFLLSACTVSVEKPSPKSLLELKKALFEERDEKFELYLKVLYVLDDGSSILSDGETAIFLPSSQLRLNANYVGKVLKMPSCSVAKDDKLYLVVRDNLVSIDLRKNILVDEMNLDITLSELTEQRALLYNGQYVKITGTVKPVFDSTNNVLDYKIVDIRGNEVFINGRNYVESYNDNLPIRIELQGTVYGYLYKDYVKNSWKIIAFGSSAVFLNIPSISSSVQVTFPTLPSVKNLRGFYDRATNTLSLSWDYEDNSVEFYIYRKYSVDSYNYYELIGRTTNKTFEKSNFTEFENSSAFAIVAYKDGKESAITEIFKDDITVQ
ncbi:MAG: hypothetical protein ACK4MM_01515 [Fervidobacterium sp.]